MGVPELNADTYVSSREAFAVALSALMRRETMTAVEHKLLALSRIARADATDRQKGLMATMVERYLRLTEAEAQEYTNHLPEEPEVTEFVTPWKERGREIGEVLGFVRGKRDALILLMEVKVGPLTREMLLRVEGITDTDLLDSLSIKVLNANSLDEMALSEK